MKMDTLQKIIMILRGYESDQGIGIVYDLDSYIERRCLVSGIIEFKQDILDIIEKSNKGLLCKVKYKLCPACLGKKQLLDDEMGYLPCATCDGNGKIKIE